MRNKKKRYLTFIPFEILGIGIPTFVVVVFKSTGPGCSKLTASLVNISLKFQMLITELCQYVLLKKNVRSFCNAKASHIFSTKISVYLVIKS